MFLNKLLEITTETTIFIECQEDGTMTRYDDFKAIPGKYLWMHVVNVCIERNTLCVSIED